jgi:hypothetical protein
MHDLTSHATRNLSLTSTLFKTTPPHTHTNNQQTELFSWATGRLISKDEAMACARRQPGRSWEACNEKLYELGAW